MLKFGLPLGHPCPLYFKPMISGLDHLENFQILNEIKVLTSSLMAVSLTIIGEAFFGEDAELVFL
jgi:hypothetical protein